jgi:RNA polymerase sigma-70 factor, ECF subfamily
MQRKEAAAMNEQKLIQLSQRGSLGSFKQLILKYQNLVYCQAYYMLSDHTKAEQIAQETFDKAYHHLPNLRGASFRTWLLQRVTHDCLEELRRQKRRNNFPFSFLWKQERNHNDALTEPETKTRKIGEDGKLQLVLQYLCQLEPELKAVIVLIDMQCIHAEDAAQVLKISASTLNKRLAQARKQLCFLLGNHQELQILTSYA